MRSRETASTISLHVQSNDRLLRARRLPNPATIRKKTSSARRRGRVVADADDGRLPSAAG
jgi:hypothetical protein